MLDVGGFERAALKQQLYDDAMQELHSFDITLHPQQKAWKAQGWR